MIEQAIKPVTYKGFALFNDIEDYELRTRNRSVVLSNIVEDNTRDQRISPQGAALVLGYFSKIPSDEREDVQKAFKASMSRLGYVNKPQ